MRILIIGAGASGVSCAINLKRENADADITIIEHLDKPLKKILATGNGKCNLGNSNLNFSLYNNELFAKQIIDGYNYEEFFDSISIKTKTINDLAYPISESAISVREALLNECRKLHIKINVNEKLLDYEVNNKILVKTDKSTYEVDKLVLAGGLLSSSKLGSDGSVIEILKNHHYQIDKLGEGLSPVITKEKTKDIDGVRVKAKVTLKDSNNVIHEETGEVLFKDHGLSGIVIFNTMSYITRYNLVNPKISLDLLEDYSDSYLRNYLKDKNIDKLLLAFINPKIAGYLKARFTNPNEIILGIKNLEFTFDKSYGYDFSQVTVGGVNVNEVDENLMSKHEKNVYIIGELLNIDGPCGGYNLTFAFASGMKVK